MSERNYMDIYSAPGTEVVFMGGQTQASINWGGNDDPTEILLVGEKYTVEKTEVHSCHTKLFLKEFPWKRFNTVWFDTAQPEYSEEKDGLLFRKFDK